MESHLFCISESSTGSWVSIAVRVYEMVVVVVVVRFERWYWLSASSQHETLPLSLPWQPRSKCILQLLVPNKQCNMASSNGQMPSENDGL